MVNVFGGTKRGPEGPPGERGPPGKKGRDALNLIKWFPTLILRELRQHVNRTSLLIENKDVDVTLDKNQVVKSWHSRSKKYPCSFTGYGGKLVDSVVLLNGLCYLTIKQCIKSDRTWIHRSLYI